MRFSQQDSRSEHFVGWTSDHWVSEALFLRDPDDNDIRLILRSDRTNESQSLDPGKALLSSGEHFFGDCQSCFGTFFGRVCRPTVSPPGPCSILPSSSKSFRA